MAENYGSLEGVLDANETLEGEIDSHDEMSGEIQFSGGVSGVKDVQVNNESVVDANKVAHIDLTPYAEKEDVYDKQTIDTALEGKADTDDIPTALSQLDNDDNYVQDSDYHHTDNNFTDEDKAAIGGIPENITDLSDVAVSNIQNGQVLKWDATQEKFVNANESGGSGDVTDVKVNGTSVVDPVTKEANIDLTGYAETSDIPTDLADLSDDATHRLVTDTEKSTWDNKADVSDIPTVNNNTITIQKNGQNVDSFTLNQNSNKAINIAVPTKTSDLQNDDSFITNTVNNLANYYLKSDTYTQTEVNNLISAAVNGRFEKVTTLPASGEPNVIYLVPKTTALTNNVYDEYIWQDNAWELLGSTEIDLSNYVTTTDLSTALADYVTSSTFNTTIANYYTKTEVGNLLDNKVDKVSGKGLSTYDYDATAKGIVDNVTTNLAGKVDKVNGKGLSTEDYTTNEKNKLSGIASGAEVNVQSDWTQTDTSADDYIKNKPTKVSDFTNDSGFTKVESSTTNGNIKIDSVETPVYRNYGNNAVLTTDKTPFLTRQTLNPTGFSGYVREKLTGASYAWNNILPNGNFADSSGWYSVGGTLSVSSNIATYTASNAINPGNARIYQSCTSIANHVYIYNAKIKVSRATQLLFYFGTGSNAYYDISANVWTKITLFVKPTASSSTFEIYTDTNGSLQGGDTVQFAETQITDLTLAFGSTIADYLYGLSNNGGITKLRDMGCPIDKYTPYGYGLYSVKTSGKKIVGFNIWDEVWEVGGINSVGGANNDSITNRIRSKNYIKVFSGTTIYIKNGGNGTVYAFLYDTNKEYLSQYPAINNTTYTLPQNCGYIRICPTTEYGTTYNHDICINISDTNKNGTYEPYSSTTYSLGNDELRGLFKLVNNEIVADGDMYESNGNIIRKYRLVDLGALTWLRYDTNKFYTDSLKSSQVLGLTNNSICSSYIQVPFANLSNKTYYGDTTSRIYMCDTSTDDADAFKSSLSGVYFVYELVATSYTTEQSTPFADPMSLIGATTEEYIDTRDIPCPVGAERQYMGQSEDVVEIPSSPQSDGKRKLIAETSGGKTQYYWEDYVDDKPRQAVIESLLTYTSVSNKYTFPVDGYVHLQILNGATAGDYITIGLYDSQNVYVTSAKLISASGSVDHMSIFVKRGMKVFISGMTEGQDKIRAAFRGIT